MHSIRSRILWRLLTAVFILGAASMPVFTQQPDDPDPNSPTPVLVHSRTSKRIYAVLADGSRRADLSSPAQAAFPPNSRVAIFVRNIDLMEGEGANAFRVLAQDSRGRLYRFPVVDLRLLNAKRQTWSLTFDLRDEAGYSDPPANGDLLIRVSWRGMTSDRGRLGYGSTGGSIADDAVPYSKLYAATIPIDTRKLAKLASPEYVGYRWSGDRMRFLEQATFGPTAALDSRVRRIGLRTWVVEQLDAPYPSASNPFPNYPLKPSTAPADCDGDSSVPDIPATCRRDTYTMYPMQSWFFREAYYGDAQLRHRVAWALSQIWVISGLSTDQSRWMTEYYKILTNNAFGNYRTLMGQMTLNPGMGNYLDFARSTKNNPNENYAREINQLFTVGLFMLNEDGTIQLDPTGNPIPTYDQETINNFTKVLTGWRFCNSGCANSAPGVVNYIDPLILSTSNHDLTAKTLFSYPGSTTTNVPACTGCDSAAIATYANNSLNQTLDNIFNHPNVGPFVSKILIQHLVTSDPTPAYVGRIAAVFNNNGSGVRGDLRAVVRAILLDPEARGDVKTDPDFGKLREPVQLATNLARAFDVSNAAGTGPSDGVFYSATNNLLTGMGQTAFYSPTVFNYYSPDYYIPGTTLNGPEFALMTTGTAISRANFVNTMVFSKVNASQPNVPSGTSLLFTEMEALAAADATGNLLMDALNQKMMHGTMPAPMRSTILTAVTNITSTNALQRAKQAIYLIATSSQYQIQR